MTHLITRWCLFQQDNVICQCLPKTLQITAAQIKAYSGLQSNSHGVVRFRYNNGPVSVWKRTWFGFKQVLGIFFTPNVELHCHTEDTCRCLSQEQTSEASEAHQNWTVEDWRKKLVRQISISAEARRWRGQSLASPAWSIQSRRVLAVQWFGGCFVGRLKAP